MSVRENVGKRKWLSVVVVLLMATTLSSCFVPTNPPCDQPELEEAIFDTPWSIDNEPDKTECNNGTALEFFVSYNDDPDATQRAHRLEQAAQQAGMKTERTSTYGSFTAAKPGSDIFFTVAVGDSGTWVITVQLHDEARGEPGSNYIAPTLQALLDAVAAAP